MSDLNPQQQKISFRWQWHWKILLFSTFFLPILVYLAFWQVSRADEKQQILKIYDQRKIDEPITLPERSKSEDQLYVRVKVMGEYDNRSPLLLDNRVRRGRPGYEVISSFQTVEGQWLLVNRGWVEASLDRRVLPEITAVTEQVVLTGYLYQSPGKQIMLGEDNWVAGAGPKVIQNAAPDVVSEKLEKVFYDYHLRLGADSPGAYETGWTIVNVQPGKHTGYAVQWGALALALIILSIFANSNLGAVIRGLRENK
jgi:surfeit locus 1 family protein